MDYQGQFVFIKGEAKRLRWTWRRNNVPVDLSNTVCRAVAKRNLNDADYVFVKEDAAFDKTRAAEGELALLLSKSDTMVTPYHENTTLLLQVEVRFPDSGEIDKAWINRLMLRATVFHD